MGSPKQYINQLINSKLIALETGAENGTEVLRLPTIKDLSKTLGVRDHIARQLYQELSAAGKIETTRGRGTFIIPPADDSRSPQYYRFGININPHNNNPLETWRAIIYEGILNASVERPEGIALMGFKPENYERALSEYDGCILFFSSASDESLNKVVAEAEDAGKPWISIDPPSLLATHNFVSSHFFEDGLKIGKALRASGRKHVVMLSNHAWEDTVSFRLRFHGVAEGLGLGDGLQAKIARIQTAWVSAEAGYSALKDYLDHHQTPDAVVASGDYVALGCLRLLKEKGLKAGSDYSLIGGTGIDLSWTEVPGLTRTAQPLQQLGKGALDLLLKQISSKNKVPGLYLPVSYLGGETTNDLENAILFDT
jgi:DNA-binding LacI/PurR family transcriptional regulator